MRLSSAVLIFALVLPASARIGYGVPGLDEPTTLWPDVWEVALGIEGGAGYTLGRNEINALRIPVALSYGWRERLELGLDVPFAFQHSDDQSVDGSGLGDVAARLKYQMTRDEGNSPASATEIRLGYGPGDIVASDGFLFGINYSVGKSFWGHSTGFLNLGYTFYGGREDIFSWGVGYERRVRDTLRLTAAVNAANRIVTRIRKDIVAELGLSGEVNPTLEYFISGGAGLTKESPDWQMRLGFRKEFGRAAGEATPLKRAEWGRPPEPDAAAIINSGEIAARTGDYALAVSYYREAVAKDPTIASAWNNMGIALFKLGRTREALEAYEKASHLDVSNADIYFNMGLAHYKLGDLLSARRSFARALELNPAHATARSNLMALEGRQ